MYTREAIASYLVSINKDSMQYSAKISTMSITIKSDEKTISRSSIFKNIKKLLTTLFTSEMDCDQTAMGLPLATSAVFPTAK
jgi:hypothetical protein